MQEAEKLQIPSNPHVRAGLEKHRQPDESFPGATLTRLIEESSQRAVAKEFRVYPRTVKKAVVEIELSVMGEKSGLPTDDRTREEVLIDRVRAAFPRDDLSLLTDGDLRGAIEDYLKSHSVREFAKKMGMCEKNTTKVKRLLGVEEPTVFTYQGPQSSTARANPEHEKIVCLGEKQGLLDTLPQRQRRLIEARYQVPERARLSLVQLAEEFAKEDGKRRSRQAIYQMEQSAIRRLQQRLRD